MTLLWVEIRIPGFRGKKFGHGVICVTAFLRRAGQRGLRRKVLVFKEAVAGAIVDA